MRIDACVFLDPAPEANQGDGASAYRKTAELERVYVAHAAMATQEEVIGNEVLQGLCGDGGPFRPLYGVRVGQLDSNHLTMAGALTTASFGAAVFDPGRLRFDFASVEIDPYLHALQAAQRIGIVRVRDADGARAEDVYKAAQRFKHLPILMVPGSGTEWVQTLDIAGRARQRGDATLLLGSGGASAAEVAGALRSLPLERVMLASGAEMSDALAGERTLGLLAELQGMAALDAFDRFCSGNAKMWLEAGV